MIELSSSISGQSTVLAHAREQLEQTGFVIGGNWEYDHGYFDQALDNEDKVWLRIPFVVTQGTLDSEQKNNQAMIRFGTPFVLKHLYNEGLEEEAQLNTVGGLVNQFQDPVDPDAQVEAEWEERAREVLRELEQSMQF